MKTALIDIRASAEAERGLMLRGFRVLRVPPSEKLPAPIASHPDMLMCKIGNTLVSSADYADASLSLFDDLNFNTGMDFSLTCDVFSDKYPYDCMFNALVIGERIFCKSDSASRGLLSLAKARKMKIIHVNQGYPACTVLPLSEKSALTADRGMAKALSDEGISVTLIDNGGIALPPYEYGFIGGAAGVYSGTVYFFGNPEYHPERKKILSAIERENLSVVALSDSPLCDFGRIIFAD